jgi:UDP-N-acetylmuramate: L-alanyl-gamma-D-glutamyl-meso-diaminopimelate ligase
MGCWSELQRFGPGDGAEDALGAGRENVSKDSLEDGVNDDAAARWRVTLDAADASSFTLHTPDGAAQSVQWQLIGRHNAMNALAAVSAAACVGVSLATACAALAQFQSPRRRLELHASVDGVRIYDDFAHHPTAVRATLQALRAAVGDARIIAVLDPASNTMRMGVHRDTLAPALHDADRVLLHRAGRMGFALEEVAAQVHAITSVHDDVADIVSNLCAELRPGDHVLIMSNGGFGGIHESLTSALAAARSSGSTATDSTPAVTTRDET